jgi:ABC-type multidrug transport system ATPase subunit
MLALEDVGVRLDGRWIVRDIGFRCEPGEVVALVGENGAGKSTVLRAVAGLVPIDRGFIGLAGEPLRGSARRRVGFVPEGADPPGFLTARDLLALTCALRSSEPLAEAERRRLYPAELESARIGTLSLGERRRVCLAAALIGDPALLVLDEPENGLDKDGAALLVEIIAAARARGAIILLASHEAPLRAALGCREIQLAGGRLS